MKARVFLYLVIAIGLLITTLDIENTGESAPPQPTANRQIFEVTIEGTVGNVAFSREGSLFLVNTKTGETAEGQNRINAWLISGDPHRRGEHGAITLGTNGRFFSGATWVDFAPVVARNFNIDAHFGEELLPNGNAFSFNGVNFETLSKILFGDLHIELLRDGEIAGTVVLTGVNPETGQVLTYVANFHGHYLAMQ